MITKAEIEETMEETMERNMDMPFEVGKSYFFRTVTYHVTGRIKAIDGKFITLEDAAWVADSGRWMQAIETGTLAEVEPVTCKVYVNTDSICDAYEWRHNLPREQK